MYVVLTHLANFTGRFAVPKVGDTVHVSSLGKKVTILKVDSSKGEVEVQAGIMKLKLKVTDIQRL